MLVPMTQRESITRRRWVLRRRTPDTSHRQSLRRSVSCAWQRARLQRVSWRRLILERQVPIEAGWQVRRCAVIPEFNQHVLACFGLICVDVERRLECFNRLRRDRSTLQQQMLLHGEHVHTRTCLAAFSSPLSTTSAILASAVLTFWLP